MLSKYCRCSFSCQKWRTVIDSWQFDSALEAWKVVETCTIERYVAMWWDMNMYRLIHIDGDVLWCNNAWRHGESLMCCCVGWPATVHTAAAAAAVAAAGALWNANTDFPQHDDTTLSMLEAVWAGKSRWAFSGADGCSVGRSLWLVLLTRSSAAGRSATWPSTWTEVRRRRCRSRSGRRRPLPPPARSVLPRSRTGHGSVCRAVTATRRVEGLAAAVTARRWPATTKTLARWTRYTPNTRYVRLFNSLITHLQSYLLAVFAQFGLGSTCGNILCLAIRATAIVIVNFDCRAVELAALVLTVAA